MAGTSQKDSHFRHIIEQSVDGVVVIDESGSIIEWNAAQERLTGWRRDEVIGRLLWDVQWEIRKRHASQGFSKAAIKKIIVDLLKTGEAPWGASPLKEEFTDADGETRFVESTVFPIKTPDGYMLASLMRDVTEQREAEKALQESEERYRRLVEASPDGIGLYCDGKIAFANAALVRLLHARSPDELLGRSPLDFILPDDRARVGANMAKILAGEEHPILSEGFLVGVDGQRVDVEMAAIGLTYEGRPAIQIVVRDISERRQLDQLKSDFIATVSHELRSPLAVILGYASLLEKTIDEENLKPVKKMRERAQAMTRLVESLLEISQIQSGKFSLRFESIDVGELLRRCAESVPMGESHVLVVSAEDSLPPLICDSNRLSIAITNLVANAVKFSPHGGTVEVGVEEREGRLAIWTRDEGVGIDEPDLPRIFERFTQADMSSTRPFGGTGMGLYITKRIVEAHGGTIDVESTPGKGSTFTIELPLRLAPAEK